LRLARFSLGWRLLLALVLVSAGYWVVMAAWTVRDSIDTIDEIFDIHLAQTALALLRVTDPDDDDPTTLPTTMPARAGLSETLATLPHLKQRLEQLGRGAGRAVAGSTQAQHENYERQLRYQVFAGDGSLLLRSSNAPETPITRVDGFSDDTDADGRTWRHYAVWDLHRDYRILVSEAHDLRMSLVRRAAVHAVTPLALGLPVLLLLLWLTVSRGLDPLGALTRELRRRRADDLSPLPPESAPREVRPLVVALNALLARVSGAVDSERRFTADAAHELRTPLAAMQAHLHMALRTDGKEHELALERLQQGLERGTRAVSQLLTLARLDPQPALPDPDTVELRALAESVCAELAPLAFGKQQDLGFECDAPAVLVDGNADLLSMLLANLVDNAIRYSPVGGRIAVVLHDARDGAGACLEVHDDGPGVPVALREQVFARFFRVPGGEHDGTGLGLPVCRRIAELHRARITLHDGPDGRGLTVRVQFAVKAAAASAR